jgi:hypothetical protein
MQNWMSHLKADPTEWLLEETNPHVRYFALRWLLDKAEDDPQVLAASERISLSEPVQKILKQQKPEGYWGSDPRPLHGTKGHLMVLRWLGYKGDEAPQKALNYRLEGCIQEDGGFAYEIKERTMYLPCHGAETLRYMLWFDMDGDPRAKVLLNWLLGTQTEEGGWPCISKANPHSCFWASAVVLRAFSELPRDWVTGEIKEARDLANEMFLAANLYEHHRSLGKPSPRWTEFGFPINFDSDVLEVLTLLGPYVDPDDDRIQEGLGKVLEKQDNAGRWPCEKHPKGGRWVGKYIPLEEIGKPSKWVTLHALRMLKMLYSSEN